jgi:mono/diheme cytochrome c family protein
MNRHQNFQALFPAVAFAVAAAFFASTDESHAAETKAEHPGAKIYREKCADCHGKNGEGAASKHDEPLAGQRNIPALAKYIAKSMPEDQEGTVVGKDADDVAAYIFDAFYSPAAQMRNSPVREDLSRLTVEEYQNSVADLIGRFQGGFDRPLGKTHGLKGRYSGRFPVIIGPILKPRSDAERAERNRKERTSYEQTDKVIAFHFGAESPDVNRLRPDDFTTRWDGSIFAPETGMYEFIVKTENGVRLFVNNSREPLIDAWVTPGPTVREEKKRIFLLGGRVYPISLEHFKFQEKSASVELHWKPPHGRQELIPEEMLEPQGRAATMVVATSFPADDRSDGYERGTTISKEWDQATTQAAIEVMSYVVANLDSLAGTKAGAQDRAAKLKDFAKRFVEAAFRRPLDDEQRKLFVDHLFDTAPSPESGVKRAVLLALKSPRFLYPGLSNDGKADDFAAASRLALALWDSIPDQQLARAAAEGKLKTRDQIAAAARRMVADPRAKAKLRGFFHHWLELERADLAAKDPKAFPGFDATMLADLRESLWMFLEEVVWSESSDYRRLINADYLWLNERLGKYYGKDVKGAEFQRVSFDPKQRVGVITHPYLLASHSYSRTTSPIHRGVFLSRNIVGLTLKNPSVAASFDNQKFDPTLTMREKVEHLTKTADCASCHSVINPFGFSLEHYDAVGRWRTKDNNKPVNALAEFDTDDGHTVKLTGPKDIADYTVNSPAAHKSFVRQLFFHTVKQTPLAFGVQSLDELRAQFEANGCNIQRLLGDIATVAAMQALTPSPQKVAENSTPAR